MKKNVLVIFGGDSTESEISIITGLDALKNMPISGYKTIPIFEYKGKFYTGSCLSDIKFYNKIDIDFLTEVFIVGKVLYKKSCFGLKKSHDIDIAVLCTHGGFGENGTLQGFLDINGIPYTSTDVETSALCMNKYYTKLVADGLGVKTLNSVLICNKKEKDEKITEAVDTIGFPLIVKPLSQGSSIGIGFANSLDELTVAIDNAFLYDDRVLLEKGLMDFIEYNVAVATLFDQVIVSQIKSPKTENKFLTFDDKYKLQGEEIKESNLIMPELEKNIKQTSLLLYNKINLSGVVRFDYIYKDNTLYLNEINTIPGNLANNLFDVDYNILLGGLINNAEKKSTKQKHSFRSGILEKIENIKKK